LTKSPVHCHLNFSALDFHRIDVNLGKFGAMIKQTGLFAAGIFMLAMFLAAALAIVDRHLGVSGFSNDVMDLLGTFGELVDVFYRLHLALTAFLQSFTIVIELLLLFVWMLAATRLLRMAIGR
jgi:hypothetical protein